MAATENRAFPAPDRYVWWFPGAPVQIHLSLDVIRRLKQQLKTPDTAPAGQGLLLGSAAEGVTRVLDFQPAAGTIPESVLELPRSSDRMLVGCYRIRTAGGLRLDESDQSLAASLFTQPYHVFLIIQPTAFGPPNASFFFNDRGGKMADFSLMEFPFEPSLLTDEEQDRLKRSQEAAARRSAPIPHPVAVQPAAHEEPALPPKRKRRLWRVLLGVLAFSLVACGITAIWAGGSIPRLWPRLIQHLSHRPVQSVVQSPPEIGLRARWQGADLDITWNRESPAMVGATSGILTITDGTLNRREIVLDEATLHRNSRIVYVPSAEEVHIEFSITTAINTVAESVVLILPRGSQLTPPTPKPYTARPPLTGDSPAQP